MTMRVITREQIGDWVQTVEAEGDTPEQLNKAMRAVEAAAQRDQRYVSIADPLLSVLGQAESLTMSMDDNQRLTMRVVTKKGVTHETNATPMQWFGGLGSEPDMSALCFMLRHFYEVLGEP